MGVSVGVAEFRSSSGDGKSGETYGISQGTGDNHGDRLSSWEMAGVFLRIWVTVTISGTVRLVQACSSTRKMRKCHHGKMGSFGMAPLSVTLLQRHGNKLNDQGVAVRTILKHRN